MKYGDPVPLVCEQPGCAHAAHWLIMAVDETAARGRERGWAFTDVVQAYCDEHVRGPRLPFGPRRLA